MKNNILVIGLGSSAYGKERRAVRAFEHMKKINPFFITSKWEDGTVTSLLNKNGFEYFATTFGYLGRSRPLWTIINIINMPMLFYNFIKYYFRNRCNKIVVLHLNSFVNVLLPILILRFLFGAKIVFYLGDIPNNSFVNKFFIILVNKVSKTVIANSTAVKNGLINLGIKPNNISVVYNGVDINKFTNYKDTKFRSEYGLSEDAFLIAHIGQISENKGIEDFIHSAEILSNHKDCFFIIIGKIDKKCIFYNKISDYIVKNNLDTKIVFTDWIDEMYNIYSSLDVVVVCSRHEEPAANINIEAMASGIPVIATKTGGTPEIIIDGETGILIEKNSTQEITENILKLKSNPVLRTQLGKNGKKRVYNYFNIQKNAAIIEEIILADKS